MATWNSSKIAYVSALIARGFNQIGVGMYATVFYHPKHPDRVIKVSTWDGWPEYILWANKAGFGGKFAPKLYHFKRYDWGYVAVMERLVCTVKEVSVAGNAWRKYTKSNEAIILHEVARACLYKNRFSCSEIKGSYPEWEAFVNAAHSNCNLSDLHDENFMLRSDGQIVMTDPCHNCNMRPAVRYSNGSVRLNGGE